LQFNEAQIQAIQHNTGPCMVIAGPGSGKTTVLTHRVRYLIERYGVNPSDILVITFTKAADNDEVYLYRYKVEGDNEPVLENIESDEEYELVSEAFDEELDAMEYEDLYEEEDNEQ
jgi:Ni2+-binding GTPase involved in maturation of urease and hydrogenase